MQFLRIEDAFISPHNIGIKDESINHALSDSEVESTDEQHEHKSCSCKENEECKVAIACCCSHAGMQRGDPIARPYSHYIVSQLD